MGMLDQQPVWDRQLTAGRVIPNCPPGRMVSSSVASSPGTRRAADAICRHWFLPQACRSTDLPRQGCIRIPPNSTQPGTVVWQRF